MSEERIIVDYVGGAIQPVYWLYFVKIIKLEPAFTISKPSSVRMTLL
jgi:hypothetical protein